MNGLALLVERCYHSITSKGEEPKMDTNKLIANRVGKGFGQEDSEKMLANFMATLTGVNLISALMYQHFISPYMAEKMQMAA